VCLPLCIKFSNSWRIPCQLVVNIWFTISNKEKFSNVTNIVDYQNLNFLALRKANSVVLCINSPNSAYFCFAKKYSPEADFMIFGYSCHVNVLIPKITPIVWSRSLLLESEGSIRCNFCKIMLSPSTPVGPKIISLCYPNLINCNQSINSLLCEWLYFFLLTLFNSVPFILIWFDLDDPWLCVFQSTSVASLICVIVFIMRNVNRTVTKL